jgi:hypothetical protein
MEPLALAKLDGAVRRVAHQQRKKTTPQYVNLKYFLIGYFQTTRAWQALLSRIAPPDMVVTDGGSGFASKNQGCVLVVLHAYRMSKASNRDTENYVHR